MRRHALLLTGLPGVGKTTVLRKVATALSGRAIRGFLTDELRSGGRRVGFQIRSFDGRMATLAHVDIQTGRRVGQYGVDVEALERMVDSTITSDDEVELFLVDEIGKMECYSKNFVSAIKRLLDSRQLVVATVAQRGRGFIAEVKDRPDVELREVTRQNRDVMPDRVLSWLERTSR